MKRQRSKEVIRRAGSAILGLLTAGWFGLGLGLVWPQSSGPLTWLIGLLVLITGWMLLDRLTTQPWRSQEERMLESRFEYLKSRTVSGKSSARPAMPGPARRPYGSLSASPGPISGSPSAPTTPARSRSPVSITHGGSRPGAGTTGRTGPTP